MLANQIVHRHSTPGGFVMERIKQGHGYPGSDLAARTFRRPTCLLALHDRISIVPARRNEEGAPETATIRGYRPPEEVSVRKTARTAIGGISPGQRP